MRDYRTVIDRSLIPHSSTGVFDAATHGAISSATKDQANQKSCISSSRSSQTPFRGVEEFIDATLPFHQAHFLKFPPQSAGQNTLRNAKRPPGNRAASSLGRIVPTEAKPSELSGCILSLAKTGVKAKTLKSQLAQNKLLNLP
jgi:hypothetical protein